MDKDKLKEAIEFARTMGLSSITVDGIKMDLSPIDLVTGSFLTEKELDQGLNREEMTEEEIKYWATPYYDELQLKKQRQQQTLKEDEDVRNGKGNIAQGDDPIS